MPETTAFVTHERDIETVDGHGSRLWLVADASDCCGALGANRLRLEPGAAGAKPHYHERSSEAFYVLDGRFEMVVDGQKILLEKGGYAVVPPRARHSFSAAPGCIADVLITLVPGVDRFDYFRMLPKLMRGEIDEQTLKEIPVRYDVHLVDDQDPAQCERFGVAENGSPAAVSDGLHDHPNRQLKGTEVDAGN